MRYKILISFLLLSFSIDVLAQQPDTKHIRIVDTLTAQERTNRNPVILRSEYDSLIQQYVASQPVQEIKEPVKETVNHNNQYILAGLVAIIVLLGVVTGLFYRHQQKINRTIAGLKEKEKEPMIVAVNGHGVVKDKKGKVILQSLETKIGDLNAELHKLSKENEGLSRVIKEYNGIQHEYDSLKHGMLKAYKVKNYPGYDRSKDETIAMQGVLDTENAVACYAYEKFLKPILVITDNNKNSPAKLNASDQEKLLDLLVSLSLLYIEYLYLRVNELSIGGKMVERIQALSKGKEPDISLLKKLNTEFGSRALVIRVALDKARLHRLSYPVFDETDLNNH